VREFYPYGHTGALSAAANFAKEDDIETVIITDGAVVSEALAACASIANAGIILLEKIKPYSECAENVASLLPESVKRIIFLEEDIRAGGMGMMLSDEMRKRGLLSGMEFEIIAVEDNFAPRHEECSMYEDAGVCARVIEEAAREQSLCR
jgi:transketolase C-terminal domain/subunit